ncbi:hypothetical protein BGZ51_007723 [Haplosporangium sp. Z 767]|nr:hypothetical protein BGZ51_007723 [Haplosporangium sp. Z 767]
MFKKRTPATKKKTDQEDEEPTSPIITVSIPQDAFESISLTHASKSSEDRGSSAKGPITTGEGAGTDIQRDSLEAKHRHSHQPWKPWDPQRNARAAANGAATDAALSTSPTLSTLSSVSSSSTAPRKGPSTLLNLPAMLTGSSKSGNLSVKQQSNSKETTKTNGSSSPHQPIEAQLWNADRAELSPLSPAGPRYIPAIAGKGANPGIGTGYPGSGIRPGNGYSSYARTLSTTSASKAGHGDRPPFRTAMSFKAHTGRNIPNTEEGQLSPSVGTFQHRQPSSPSLKGIHEPSTIGNGTAQSYRSHRTGTGSEGSIVSAGRSLEMSWNNGRNIDNRQFNAGKMNEYDYHSDQEDLIDRKKDRPFLQRPQEHHAEYPLLFRDPKRALRTRLFCLRQNRRLHPCVRLVVLVFLAGSVCFTTFQLIVTGGSVVGINAGGSTKSFDYNEQQLRIRKLLGQRTIQNKVLSQFDVEAQNYTIHQWALDTYDINGSKAIARVSEDYMLSKAFNGAMQPTRVIPFYFRASFADENDDDDLHEDEDIRHDQHTNSSGYSNGQHRTIAARVDPSLVTITTLITPDRYGVFLKLVRQYRGPISVATHIRRGEDQDKSFQELHDFFQEHPILRKYVDLHVIVDGVDFQLNMWRNVARLFARTDYFMMLDVDFHIPSGLKYNLHHDPRLRELLSSGAALVIPAFEYSLDKDPKDSKYFPDTKADLLPLLEKKHIRVFHDSFPPGHAATDTPRWMKMSQHVSIPEYRRESKGRAGFEEDYGPDLDATAEGGVDERQEYLEREAEGEKPYKVTNFVPKYEPYIVLKREGTPWCDERFVGYGANKAACLFEMYISGIDFWVVPQDFLIHQYHDYPTTNRKNGRILNKQLFVSFQQEICFTTLQRMIMSGEWYTSKADNLRHQCSVFEGFLKSADQMAMDFEERHPNSLLEDPVFVADEDADARRQRLLKALQSSIHDDAASDRGEDDAHNEHSRGKVALSQQIVDDENHQDPFMSRPKGKVWGGIQPKTYYVPPPPEEGADIPIEGINMDVAVEGTVVGALDGGESHGRSTDKISGDGGRGNDLSGENLERFRQGIILPGHDVQRPQPVVDGGSNGRVQEQKRPWDHDSNQERWSQYADEDAEDQDQNEHDRGHDRLSASTESSAPPSSRDEPGDRSKPFEEEAIRLEKYFQELGV